jgi:hypothetical protein
MVLIVPPAAAVTGLFFYHRHQAQVALDEAIAETDRLDPGWRLEDIEKRRTAVPPEQNAAVHIAAAAALIPTPFIGRKDEDLLGSASEFPQCQIDAELAEALRKALQPLLPADALVRKAVLLKTGWYPIRWTPDIIFVRINHVQETRKVGWFLSRLAMLRSQDGKHDDALQTSLAIFAVGRSLGEEPLLITALVRIDMQSMAVNSLERCLAQGTVNDDVLADAQRQLIEEGKEPVLLHCMRGNRACFDMMMSNLESGKVTLADILAKMRTTVPPQLWPYYAGSGFQKDHAWMLRHHNQEVEYAKLPLAEMRAKMDELIRHNSEAPPLAMWLFNFWPRTLVSESAVRSHCFLDCALAGIGVERFRLAQGRWPNSLEEVVAAKLLDKVATDHFDGEPLRFRQASDGVVVYSIGPKGNYAGDCLDPEKTIDPTVERVEFRLWDEKHRRQPPRPRPKDDDDKDGDEILF